MHVVVVYGWQKEEAEVASIIAAVSGAVAFEARQKIAGGGPAVLANFADSHQAESLAGKLSRQGVPALVLDSDAVRNQPAFNVRRFVLGPQTLQLESFSGETCEVDFSTVSLVLVASCSVGQSQTTRMETERKFSLGKTILAGGVPMTKAVKTEKIINTEERDETLRLYADSTPMVVFDRSVVSFDGLGDAMKLSRDLNFNYLKKELRRLAPQARYDDRLLKRGTLVRVLGPALNPGTDLDLAFEIMSRSLQKIKGTEAMDVNT